MGNFRRHGKTDSLLIHSRGGLGNQLFAFLAGLSRADQLDCRLLIDSSQHWTTASMPFHLSALLSKLPEHFSERVQCLRAPLTLVGRRLRGISIPQRCDFIERSFRFDPDFYSLEPGSCAFGYFQSWRYLEVVRRERLIELREAVKQLAESSVAFESRDIVIHIRRGDYLKAGVREVHGVLSYRYYSDAIALLRKAGHSGRVWAVSESKLDDLQALESSIGTSITQVGASNLWTDFNTLVSSPALVIANSTFSWMAGWLNEGAARVVAPRPWFYTDRYDTSDLIPPTWLTVDHDFGD